MSDSNASLYQGGLSSKGSTVEDFVIWWNSIHPDKVVYVSPHMEGIGGRQNGVKEERFKKPNKKFPRKRKRSDRLAVDAEFISNTGLGNMNRT